MKLTLTLAVRDLDKTESYYREVLHLPVERFIPLAGHPPVLLVRCGDADILFREMEVLATLHPAVFQNLDRHPPGAGMSLELSVTNLSEISRTVSRKRLHTLYELEDEEFGRRELWLSDPDGYLLVLQQEEPPKEEN